ncbi:hypothetical protein V2J09_015822 [Rumex salicifolius]
MNLRIGSVNSMMIAWILEWIDPWIQYSIYYKDTVKSLWDDMRQCFSLGNPPWIHQLRIFKITLHQYIGVVPIRLVHHSWFWPLNEPMNEPVRGIPPNCDYATSISIRRSSLAAKRLFLAPPPSSSISLASKPFDSKVSCSHCDKKGNKVASGFKLIGFLEWWGDLHQNQTSLRGRGHATLSTVEEEKMRFSRLHKMLCHSPSMIRIVQL